MQIEFVRLRVFLNDDLGGGAMYAWPEEPSEESLPGLIRDSGLDTLVEGDSEAPGRGVAVPLISMAPAIPQAIATAPPLIVML